LLDNRDLFNQNFLNFVPMVCCLMVVMIHQHTVAGDIYTVSSRSISFFTHGICTTAVPMFFVISGYLFFRNAYTFSDGLQKQKRRIKTVLMPFLAWSAFYYLMYAVVSVVVPGFLQSNVDLNVFGVIKGIVFYEYAFPMWYMFQLCVYILLAPVLLIAIRNKAVSVIILTVSSGLGIIGCAEWQVNLGGYERTLFHGNFFAYYWLGCLLARWPNVQEKLLNLAKRIPWVILAVLFVIAGLLESFLFDGIIPSVNNRCTVPLVFIAFFLLMVKLCHRMKEFPSPKVSTMVIYGVHSAVGVIVGKFIVSGWELPAIVYFVLRFLMVTAGSVLAAWIMRYIKPIHWVFSGDR